VQRLFDVVELERLDDRFDLLHRGKGSDAAYAKINASGETSQLIPPFILLTAAETRDAEARAIAGGLSGKAMMEAAGEAAASFIIRTMSPRPAAILCGPGNNGGDGFVIARKLKQAGWQVRLALFGERAALKGDAALMASLYDGAAEPLTPAALEGAGVIVDALFGTGLSRTVDGAAKTMIEAANAHPAPVVAIDIPSGVDADTGAVLGAAIEAMATVTFITRKPGHLLFPGRALCGQTHVADIGVAAEHVAGAKPRCFENHPALFVGEWRRLTWATHKYVRGHAAVVSGPRLKTGAARLAATAALRAGAGLVTMLSPADAANENAAHLTSVMIREADGAAAIAATLADPRFTAALIGPGAGVGAETRASVLVILASSAGAVLDADALTSFANDSAALFEKLRPDDVLTPHAGEFARLFPQEAALPGGRVAIARAAARRAGAVVVLKGADTVIAAPEGRCAINANAPFDLATAGSGDVLAGVITGSRATSMIGFESALSGVFLHGACGQIAGPGLIAEDLIAALPRVLSALLAPPSRADQNA
jgi:NAD(P)H-hydrate epimerase